MNEQEKNENQDKKSYKKPILIIILIFYLVSFGPAAYLGEKYLDSKSQSVLVVIYLPHIIVGAVYRPYFEYADKLGKKGKREREKRENR